ncbi:MAG: hypothetical protein E7638_01285 [Ruminococcaceae bacterium]|nr:hypothetical protein [Oscillospiraceae bacterium]
MRRKISCLLLALLMAGQVMSAVSVSAETEEKSITVEQSETVETVPAFYYEGLRELIRTNEKVIRSYKAASVDLDDGDIKELIRINEELETYKTAAFDLGAEDIKNLIRIFEELETYKAAALDLGASDLKNLIRLNEEIVTYKTAAVDLGAADKKDLIRITEKEETFKTESPDMGVESITKLVRPGVVVVAKMKVAGTKKINRPIYVVR